MKEIAMARSRSPKQDIAEDVLRIRRLITRALKVSVEQSASYARDGYPDQAHRSCLPLVSRGS
jgi:hypothetical protein